ncbi:lea domain protein [Colletotrichum sojae]|uniref:Lea domain protein n=1 Tax=Colletotrichum sojae TaxID=2175907 RepID=A0A8H6JPE7_9PEZI|nr:lea domain protein [Colletotrichum sojae]
MAGAASKSGSSMPGGWGKEGDKKSTYSVEQDIQDHGENLVAGVIGKTGEVVDETGKTVGKVTEGEAGDLVGNVVTATGDIIGKDGGVIGKALPLGELTENLTEGGESKEGGGFSIMGATKGVKGIVDTVDGTVQTVNRTLPLVGDLTKGIGLGEGQGGVLGGVLGGDQSEKGKSQSGLLGSVLGGGQSEKGTQPGVLGSVLGGTQPLERDENVTEKDEKLTQVLSQKPEDPEDKISVTEDAKKSLFEDNEKTSEVAPVDLQDNTPQEQNGKLTTGENTQSESEADKTELTAPSTIGDKQSELAELEPEPLEDATEQAETIKDDVSEKADSAKDFGTEQPTTARDFATEQGSQDGDAPSHADLTEEELRSRIPDEIATLDIPVSQIPEGLKSEIPDDLKTADIPVSQIPLDAQTQLPDDLVSQLPEDLISQLPEEVQSKLPTDAQTGDIPKSQLPTDAQTGDIPKSQLPTDAQTGDIPQSQLPTDIQTEDIPASQRPSEDIQTADIPESQLDDAQSGYQSGYQSRSQSGYGIPKSEVKDDISTVLSTIRSAIPSDQRTVSVAGSKILQPFEKFPGAEVNDEGKVVFDNVSIGRVLEGDPAELVGKTIDAEGNIINERGSIIGKAELKSEVAEELLKDSIDYSILKGAKVNKAGNLVNDKGEAIGRVVSGILKHLVGRKANEKGEIWNDAGKVIGKAEPIPETEREELSDPAPFEDFPGATVESNGHVLYNGEIVGRVIEGDPKKLKGKKVDDDGDILDRSGNTIGKAERWEPEPEAEPEPEPEVVIDRSALAGKRVNKAGNVVDNHGTIFGRIIEGDVKRLVGRMCDKDGNVRSESGDIIGKAELVPEGEREGFKEGPFAELPGCTVNKEGHVVTPGGDIVGRLIQGDPKVLFGRVVDEDGDILDRNGNTLGKAERWEPEPEPEVEKKKGPMAGRKVNRKGEVVDEDGDIIGKLTTGDLSICAGKEIDDDGDVVDSKGHTVGHCSLLEDIPEPEPEPEVEEEPQEDPAEVKAREEAEADRKLARSLGSVIEQGLDRMRPICKMITQKIEKAERTPKDELDEEQLVKDVRPLIEEGGKILSELNGSVRALDPDGRIQRNAKHKSSTREATPEEHHLAEVLKELTGAITETVEGAKRKIEDMPHAKKELNPLWGLLTEPLGQILAAVGLLLAGVLNLVGRLLSGLGLGGIVDGLLGTLGLNRLLEGLGLGSLTTALRGGKNKKK